MLKLAANLSLLYHQDLAFLDRLRRPRPTAFRRRVSRPYAEYKEKVAETLKTNNLVQAAFIAMGDGDKDHSGLIRTLEALAGDKP